MATAREDPDAVREWLLCEVKLDRYADKLVSNGFTSLETCCTINEDALDKMGIIMPYHRRRFLMFAEKLREKLGTDLTNEEGIDGVSSNMELIGQGSETGNKQESSLISFDSGDESGIAFNSAFNDQRPKEDSGNIIAAEGVNDEEPVAPILPPKKHSFGKLPPPIPPRADLEEGEKPAEQASKASDAHTQDSNQVEMPLEQHQEQQQQPEVPAKKPPLKPPRRTITKPPSGNAPEYFTKTNSQNGMQEQHTVSSSSNVSNAMAVDPTVEEETLVQINSTSAFPELPKAEKGGNEVTSSERLNEETPIATNAPRVVPKAPERSSSKRPTPAPRSVRPRMKSEDNVLVSDLIPKSDTEKDSKDTFSALLNNTLEKRTQSFSAPGGRKIHVNSSEGKPSTIPRSVSTKRPAPPPPPTRQTGSLKGPDKREIFDLPLPPIPVTGNTDHRQSELVSAAHQG